MNLLAIVIDGDEIMSEDLLALLKDLGTLLIAMGGFALGVINTVKLYIDDRVRLKVLVIPIVAVPLEQFERYKIRVTVRNLSKFPLTIEDANFINMNKEQLIQIERLVFFRGKLSTFPVELPPRTSLLILLPHPNEEYADDVFDHVRVRTQCGHTALGTCRILREN